MVRTQIALDAEDHQRAKRRAAELGISLAAYIRSVVHRDLGEPRPVGDVAQIFSLGDSGGSDIAERKDEYVAEAVDAEHLRSTSRAPA